jgi:sporulation protein YlmC with PRC-barrel domain
VFLSELLGSAVIDEAGAQLGRLLDVRLDEERTRISGIVIDDSAFPARLVRGRGADGRTLPLEALPWEVVVELTPGRVVVRSDSRTDGRGTKTS